MCCMIKKLHTMLVQGVMLMGAESNSARGVLLDMPELMPGHAHHTCAC